jgi:hypothetical protein
MHCGKDRLGSKAIFAELCFFRPWQIRTEGILHRISSGSDCVQIITHGPVTPIGKRSGTAIPDVFGDWACFFGGRTNTMLDDSPLTLMSENSKCK